MPADELWYGSIGTSAFLFDPSLQSETSADYVLLFSSAFDRPVKFTRSEIRPHFRRLTETATCDAILERYENWKRFYRSELNLTLASPALDAARFAALAWRGEIRDFVGRAAHCFGCGAALKGNRGNLCPECFWIKCGCGACGCNY